MAPFDPWRSASVADRLAFHHQLLERAERARAGLAANHRDRQRRAADGIPAANLPAENALDLRGAEASNRVIWVDDHRQRIAGDHDLIELVGLFRLKIARGHTDLGHAIERRANAGARPQALDVDRHTA